MPIGRELDFRAYCASTLSFVLQMRRPMQGLSCGPRRMWLAAATYVPQLPDVGRLELGRLDLADDVAPDFGIV